MASEITAINDDGTLVRPMYAGNVLATIELDGPVRGVTVPPADIPEAPGSLLAPEPAALATMSLACTQARLPSAAANWAATARSWPGSGRSSAS